MPGGNSVVGGGGTGKSQGGAALLTCLEGGRMVMEDGRVEGGSNWVIEVGKTGGIGGEATGREKNTREARLKFGGAIQEPKLKGYGYGYGYG